MLGQVKMTVLLGFTLAAYNLDRIRSFRAKRAQDEGTPRGGVPSAARNLGHIASASGSVVPGTRPGPPTSRLENQQRISRRHSSRFPARKSQYRLTRNCRPEGPAVRHFGVADESCAHRHLQQSTFMNTRGAFS